MVILGRYCELIWLEGGLGDDWDTLTFSLTPYLGVLLWDEPSKCRVFILYFFFLLFQIQNWNKTQALTSFLHGGKTMSTWLLAKPMMLSAWYLCIFSISYLDVVSLLKYLTVTLFVVDRWLYFWVSKDLQKNRKNLWFCD